MEIGDWRLGSRSKDGSERDGSVLPPTFARDVRFQVVAFTVFNMTQLAAYGYP